MNNRKKLWLAISVTTFIVIGMTAVLNVTAANVRPELKKTSFNVLIGKTTKLAIKKKIPNSIILWKSSNKRIASVTKNGKIKGVNKGNAKITATVIVNKKKRRLTCKVRVIRKAKRIVVTTRYGKADKNVDLTTGNSTSLKVTKKPKDSNDFVASWKSKNTSIASINKSGVVTAKKSGTTIITATMFGKAKATIRVTVNDKVNNDNTPGPKPTFTPTNKPTDTPTGTPTNKPTDTPTSTPIGTSTDTPTSTPTNIPTDTPTSMPTDMPIDTPTSTPTDMPTDTPTSTPTDMPIDTPTSTPTSTPTDAWTDITYDFSNSTQGFTGRGPTTVSATSFEGDSVLHVTGRTESWNGANIDLTNVLKVGHTYEISAEMLHTADSNETVDCSLEIKLPPNADAYPGVASASVQSNTWKMLKGRITIEDFNKISLYFQIPSNATADFYLKNIHIKEFKWDTMEILSYESLAELAEQYGFSMGTCIDYKKTLENSFTQIMSNHFNSVTAGNEMKAYSLLDQKASIESALNGDGTPRMDFTAADKIMEFAQDNGIKVRGHTLVWDQFMLSWFFREGYRSDGAFVTDVDVMKTRLESYIKQVLEHFQTKFPGVIYAWDVVNEAVGDSEYEDLGDNWDNCHVRTHRDGEENPFYRYIGRDYVKLSFQYAHKYAAKGVELFYNDYSTIVPDKRNAICNLVNEINKEGKLVDGVGMQCYIDMDYGILKSYTHKDYPSLIDSVNAFYDLGMEVHLTELTVRNRDINRNREHAYYFWSLFEAIKNLNRENAKIKNVSIWGFIDVPNAQEGDYIYGLCGTYFGLIDELYRPKESFIKVYESLKSGFSEITPYKIETFETCFNYDASLVKGDGGIGEIVDLGVGHAYSGSKILLMKTTDNWHGPQYIVENTTDDDLIVSVSAMVKTHQSDARIRFVLDMKDKDGKSTYPEYSKISTSDQWQEIMATITIPVGAEAKIRIAPQDEVKITSYYVDDFKIEY